MGIGISYKIGTGNGKEWECKSHFRSSLIESNYGVFLEANIMATKVTTELLVSKKLKLVISLKIGEVHIQIRR